MPSLQRGASRSEPQRLVLVRLGAVDENLLSHLSTHLAHVFEGLETTVDPAVLQLPHEAFNPARTQYNSAKLLAWAQGLRMASPETRALLVTGEDLFVPGLNFVLGQAQYPGRLAIISVHRLQPTFYGLRRSPELLGERACKEAVHELAHTYGIAHCQNASCVMCFSNTILDVDAKSSAFCPRCAESLAEAR